MNKKLKAISFLLITIVSCLAWFFCAACTCGVMGDAYSPSVLWMALSFACLGVFTPSFRYLLKTLPIPLPSGYERNLFIGQCLLTVARPLGQLVHWLLSLRG